MVTWVAWLANKHQLYNNIVNIVLIRLSYEKVIYIITLIHIQLMFIRSFQMCILRNAAILILGKFHRRQLYLSIF